MSRVGRSMMLIALLVVAVTLPVWWTWKLMDSALAPVELTQDPIINQPLATKTIDAQTAGGSRNNPWLDPQRFPLSKPEFTAAHQADGARWLRGRVLGLDPKAAESAAVQVAVLEEPTAWHKIAPLVAESVLGFPPFAPSKVKGKNVDLKPDGSFAIDLRRSVKIDQESRRLRVSLLAEGWLPSLAEIEIPELVRHYREAAFEETVELATEPAIELHISIKSNQRIAPSARPLLAWYPATHDSVATEPLLTKVVEDFSKTKWAVPASNPGILVAAVPGQRPAYARLDPRATASPHQVKLKWQQGETFECRLQPPSNHRAQGTILTLENTQQSATLQLGEHALAFVGDQLVWQKIAFVAEQERVQLAGLKAGDYRLSFGGTTLPHRPEELPELAITIPSGELVVPLPMVPVPIFAVVKEHGPRKARLQIRDGQTLTEVHQVDHPLLVWLPDQTRCEVHWSASDVTPLTDSLSTYDPLRDHCWFLDRNTGTALLELPFHQQLGPSTLVLRSKDGELRDQQVNDDNRWLLPRLAVGEHIATLQLDPHHPLAPMIGISESRILIQPDRPNRARLSVAIHSLLQIEVIDPKGDRLAAECLRYVQGNVVDTEFAWNRPDGGSQRRTNGLFAEGPAIAVLENSQPLAILEITHPGYHTKVIHAEVAPGTVQKVSVTLEAKLTAP